MQIVELKIENGKLKVNDDFPPLLCGKSLTYGLPSGNCKSDVFAKQKLAEI